MGKKRKVTIEIEESTDKIESREEIYSRLEQLAKEYDCIISYDKRKIQKQGKIQDQRIIRLFINENLSEADKNNIYGNCNHWNLNLGLQSYDYVEVNEFTPQIKDVKPKIRKKKGRKPTVDPNEVFKLIIEKRNKVKKEKFTCSYVFNYILKPLMLSEGYLRTIKVKKYLNLIPALKGKNQSVWQHIITDKHIEIMKEKLREQKN